MLIEGAGKKDDILVEQYVRLLNSGVVASKILVLVQNSNKKQKFIDKTFEKLEIDCVEKLEVHSFFGLVYNTILDNWAYLENQIKDSNTSIFPNMIGLELSQFILRDILGDVQFKGYNSKKSLLHQLFRRYSLIVQNNLDEKGIDFRSELLKESFAPDAKQALKLFMSKTLGLRSFDYLRQSLIFNHIYQKTSHFANVEYLILDDGDEVTPICLDFIKFLRPQLKEVFIAYDNLGSSRCGYLSAEKSTEFEQIFGQNPVCHAELVSASHNLLNPDAKILFDNVIEQKQDKLAKFSLNSHSKRAKMLDEAVLKVKSLIEKGVAPNEISIVTPVIDDMLKASLREALPESLFLSGSEKLSQNPLVKASLTILKMTNPESDLSQFDIRIILNDILGIPIKYCREILEHFEKSKTLIDFEFADEDYTKAYAMLKQIVSSLSSEQTRHPEFISGSVIERNTDEMQKHVLHDVVGLKTNSEKIYKICELFEFAKYKKNDINKFNFFIKQLEDFEKVFAPEVLEFRKNDILNQIEHSIIAENPYSNLEISSTELVVATPQKIIDNQIETKYQIWLDVTSDEWVKSDTGPLYNAWVMQAGWDKPEFTIEDNLSLSLQKTARILRKLTLCASEKVYCYSSLFDGTGIENFGGIERYLNSQVEEIAPCEYNFMPREDQKPVLEYKSGKMAISAVPGAGKTTVLLALILKLLDDGINPENIFVLTYMDSAARNFRERIKNIHSQSSQLPNISTIHGLALKILKENSNFERLGLNQDFEICDDTQRSRIVREISFRQKLKKGEFEEFDRAISVLKFSGGAQTKTGSAKLSKFLGFYNEYQEVLSENNLIDYDDMLLFSVRLLQENPDILEYYQNLCHYIIEDEAQDSSSIQQKLIELLSSKHKNLIRCGDVNQAITTTFSNADVEGFKNFIKTSNSVEMNRSQRCSHDVYELANKLIFFAQKDENLKNAFYKIFMKPVEGKNPQEKNGIFSMVFENGFAEKNYVQKQIKAILTKEPKATIGVLLRNNYQVKSWAQNIENSGLKAITRSECLEQKSVFRTIFAVLKIIQNPFNHIEQHFETLCELGHYAKSEASVGKMLKQVQHDSNQPSSNSVRHPEFISGSVVERNTCEMPKQVQDKEIDFINQNADDINDISLTQFYWDMNYWLSFTSTPIEDLAIKIGLHYHTSEVERSNVYLISTLIKRLGIANSNFDNILQRLEELSKKPSLSGFKFFGEEEDSEFMHGKVQIMTLHKSKGDEFDYVFLPEMAENSLNIDFDGLKLKANSNFTEEVRNLNQKYNPKTEAQLKQFILAENLRLLYVAITRAKRKLFITTSKIVKTSYGSKTQPPSIIFDKLLKKGV